MKKKLIEFIPMTRTADLVCPTPDLASKHLPDWYKKIPPYMNGDKKLRMPKGFQNPNTTVKKCVPFLESLSNGYMVTLSEDIFVERAEGSGHFIRWRSDSTLVTWHDKEQVEGIPMPYGHTEVVTKWHNEWKFKTPKGYGLMFTHPLNRFDLPFTTLTGFVDTDKHPIPVQFPFVVRKDFEGIIEAGTPICQIIPFKYDEWKSKTYSFDEDKSYKERTSFFKTFTASYRKNFWKKKSYE